MNIKNIPEGAERPPGRKWDILLKIISVLMAVLIWFVVLFFESTVIQRTFPAVEVEILNFAELQAHGYTILGTDNFYVDVTLEGTNLDLNRINRSAVRAYIDLQDVDRAGEIMRPIQIRELNYATVANQSQSSIILHIDRNITRVVPVTGEVVRIVTDAGTETGELSFAPEAVTVSGPAQLIDRIAYAQVYVDLGTTLVQRSRNVRESFVWVDGYGDEIRSPYLRWSENTIEVYVPVYTTKEVPLRVAFRYGYYNEANVSVRITPATVWLRGSPDYLNNLDEIIIAVINEKEFDRDVTLRQPIVLPGEPGDTRELSGITSADIEIEFIGMAPRPVTVGASRFRVTPPAGLEYGIQEPELQVQLFGPVGEINRVPLSAVVVSMDLSEFTEAGMYFVPVSVSVTDGSSVFAVGEYRVSVEIY